MDKIKNKPEDYPMIWHRWESYKINNIFDNLCMILEFKYDQFYKELKNIGWNVKRKSIPR